ncbi:MerR family transcriptional regulator [Streptomyces sp. DSM 42041]|uniref:MerR family transcriptional regulator n=1 Tax=Streptomyces hazeniae TaxID=3075538 RepID=A0ABU2NTW2_9ACTN|nr:MerR family transcriptional regulator [Streptomyces sp. DSM 42041]MDT0380424.1 MerR family transcriptional regulator [Streptomyces sp. DSM 42041]
MDASRPEHTAGLTTGAVARRIGVSPTTLRSWDRRYGLGPSLREQGRHRRWTPGDIAVLEEMCRLTSAGVPPAEAAKAALGATGPSAPVGAETMQDAEKAPAPPTGGGGLPLGDVRQECRGLARAAVRLDATAVQAGLTTAIGEYGLVSAWEEVMMPALRAVGLKWSSSGDRYVEVEHLLSWHVSATLRAAAAAAPGDVPGTAPARHGRSGRGGPVVLACVPGELHALPLEALAAGLARRGLPVLMFGAAVPVPALEEAVRRAGPSAVVLWAQTSSAADWPLARHVGAMGWGVRGARRRPAVVAAGPGWASPHLPLPGAHRPHGLRDALSLLENLSAA